MSSIEQLKSTIVKRGGLAKANRFSVYLTPPESAIVNTDLESIGAALVNGGQNIINDPRDISILCESITIPGRQITSQEYSSGHYTRKMPTGFIEEDVNVTFLLTNDYYIKRMFDRWINLVIPVNSKGTDFELAFPNEYTTNIVINQLDEKDIPIYNIKLMDAYPINVNSIELSNTAENTIARVTVTFAYKAAVNENIIDSGTSVVKQIRSSFQSLPSAINNIFG